MPHRGQSEIVRKEASMTAPTGTLSLSPFAESRFKSHFSCVLVPSTLLKVSHSCLAYALFGTILHQTNDQRYNYS